MMKFFSQLVTKFKNANSTMGFTMIELLIVIAILGILAVAVLSAINPVEQINRGRDTGSRSDAEQLLSAIDRYNAFAGYYPWQNGASDTTYDVAFMRWSTAGGATGVLQNTTGCAVSDLLSAGSAVPACTGSNELKVTYFTRIFGSGYNYLSIYHGSEASNSTYVCFAPKSDAFKTEAAARVTAGTPTDYPAGAIGDLTGICGPVGTASNCICLP
ncbi:prepilin-type N-terminal cleavage/methylation domain-containing protein [Candidatus Woesebacteria bacterium]|nr:prepilin-type N-terminal cleavage/methylation domain-containing protein [Candidatus Woesebacteria bacterium]